MPEQKRLKERRRSERHQICFPLSYKVLKMVDLENLWSASSETINVSHDGLSFSVKSPVKIDSVIEIKIPFQGKEFSIKAHVVRCSPVPDSRFYDIGVYFNSSNDVFKSKMIEQIYMICDYRDTLSSKLGREISLQEASIKWMEKYSEKSHKLSW